MTAQRWPEDVGSVGEEAGRLLESLRRAGLEAATHVTEPASAAQGRTESARSSAAPGGRDGAAPGGGAPADAAPAGDAPDAAAPVAFSCDDPVCQWCPVCRASTFVRRLSPETLSGLAELAGFAATVLSDLAGARARQEAGRPGAGDARPGAARTPAAEEEPRG